MDHFRETEQLVRYYFDKRAKALAKAMINGGTMERLVIYIDAVLKMLEHDQRCLLQNEFVENYPRNWWQDYYSRSAYYRLKKEAMLEFLAKLKN